MSEGPRPLGMALSVDVLSEISFMQFRRASHRTHEHKVSRLDLNAAPGKLLMHMREIGAG